MKIRVKYRNYCGEIITGEFAAVICDNSNGLCGMMCFADSNDIGTHYYLFIDSEDIIHVYAIWPDNI